MPTVGARASALHRCSSIAAGLRTYLVFASIHLRPRPAATSRRVNEMMSISSLVSSGTRPRFLLPVAWTHSRRHGRSLALPHSGSLSLTAPHLLGGAGTAGDDDLAGADQFLDAVGF